MRLLVLSDVHSNLAALEAVLADAGEVDGIWALGDIVGYGPHPNECLALLQEQDHLAIAGNHDWGVLGKLDLSRFNTPARIANLWNREQLDTEAVAYLEALPTERTEGSFHLAHGSPQNPIWEYILTAAVARMSFDYFQTPVCLVGHTHVPVIFQLKPDGEMEIIDPAYEEGAFSLNGARFIINPGSVGQPRDGDPRAAYAILDTEAMTITHRRVIYDLARTQEAMRAAELPHSLSARLELGW